MVIFVDNLPVDNEKDNLMWLSSLLMVRVRYILQKEGVHNIPQMWEFFESLATRQYPRNWGYVCTYSLGEFLREYCGYDIDTYHILARCR